MRTLDEEKLEDVVKGVVGRCQQRSERHEYCRPAQSDRARVVMSEVCDVSPVERRIPKRFPSKCLLNVCSTSFGGVSAAGHD